jgi:hypothetical protein
VANDIVNDIANCIVNAINNCIDSTKANSPLHVKVNDLANAIDKESVNRIVKVYPMYGFTYSYFMTILHIYK